MQRADDGLTEVKPISKIFKNVIVNDTDPRDKTVNDHIQEKGAEYWGAGSEAAWYRRNKGYSKKITSNHKER